MHIAVRQILLSCWDIKNGRSVPKLIFPFFSLFFFNTSLQALGGQRNLTDLRTSLPLVLFLFYFFSCLCMLNWLLSLEAMYPRCVGEVPECGGDRVFFDFIRALQNSTFLDEWS
ncbi:hypothetical protein BDC45DRAFT_497340 [Circinella umbellata]|nr:hypothetical protein BDC45DRAFT_497329 [Circinella umbellata]KAI7859317.1 hypothetical protein BDC45DRAFT_497340 [Circinella umbellata]